jgi:Lrp/AsnC family transcriptional regulator, leucine-responsive regulatory protein
MPAAGRETMQRRQHVNLDDWDRKIISMFAANPSVSQDDIAAAVDLSQPSVAMRIRKLRQMGAIETQAGINPFAMGLFVAKVDISSNDPGRIVEMFRGCPYFANAFTVSGRHNLCLLFLSENLATLESIVNGHIRTEKSVSDVEFNIIISSEKTMTIPVVLTPERTKVPPCGILINCKDCKSFDEDRCLGCPATGQYKGWFY